MGWWFAGDDGLLGMMVCWGWWFAGNDGFVGDDGLLGMMVLLRMVVCWVPGCGEGAGPTPAIPVHFKPRNKVLRRYTPPAPPVPQHHPHSELFWGVVLQSGLNEPLQGWSWGAQLGCSCLSQPRWSIPRDAIQQPAQPWDTVGTHCTLWGTHSTPGGGQEQVPVPVPSPFVSASHLPLASGRQQPAL